MQTTPFEQRTRDQHLILETWDMILEQAASGDDQFASNGRRFAITVALRTLAAIHSEATRQEFIGAMLANGLNETTLRIQFNQSRRNSAEWFGLELQADGSLKEKAAA